MDFDSFYELVNSYALDVYFKELNEGDSIMISIESLASVKIKNNEHKDKFAYISGKLYKKFKEYREGLDITFSMTEKSFKACIGRYFARCLLSKSRANNIYNAPIIMKITKTSKRLANFEVMYVISNDSLVPFEKYVNTLER